MLTSGHGWRAVARAAFSWLIGVSSYTRNRGQGESQFRRRPRGPSPGVRNSV